MSESAANPNAARSLAQAPALPHPSVHVPPAGAADSSALPPALTPATTTRQSVALGVFSNLWATGSTTAPRTADEAHAIWIPSLSDAPEQTADLAASSDSVPSTATTLTNTLPPLQSAAIRALNAPAFQSASKTKSAKSTSSRTTLTSQPVVVRTYSGSRHPSRPGSGLNTPRSFAMGGPSNASNLSVSMAGRTTEIPSADEFSFSAILRAVDPEIRGAIDAIAEICARSRMSLADEYEAHLPPQGEITSAGPTWVANTGALAGRGRLSRISQGWTAADNTLMAVPEASSSSERLAQESRGNASQRKRSQSAYGSLKSVISGGSGQRKPINSDTFQPPGTDPQPEQQSIPAQAWVVNTALNTAGHSAITLVAPPQASKQLSPDPLALEEGLKNGQRTRPQTATPQHASAHRLNVATATSPSSRSRSSTLSSLTTWLPWPRSSGLDINAQQELAKAETRLREMLSLSQNFGKGKAPMRAV
jgi:hypothetical protein